MKSSILLLGAVAAGVLAAPAPHDFQVHERRDNLPRHWIEGRRLDKKTTLPVRIGLTQTNLDQGHDFLMDVSNPSSSRYGQHFTPEEIHDLFAPAKHSVDGVREWLESAGISGERISQSVNKQWIQFDAAAEELEDLLHTEYYIYDHAHSGKSHVAASKYYVPKHLREHIDYITPGIMLREVAGVHNSKRDAIEKRGFSNSIQPITSPLTTPIDLLLGSLLQYCDAAVTPQCIQSMYNISQGTSATPGNQMGIFEDIGDVYSQEDLNEFFATLYSTIPQGTHPTLKAIDGAKAPNPVTSAGPESDLDFQISYPIIWPQNSVLFQTDDMHYENQYTFRGFLNTFLDAIDGSYCSYVSPLDPKYPDPAANGWNHPLQCGVYKPTNVVSISYGEAEADLPISYQRRQCNEFMKLGLQGTTVFVASGDSGVSGRGGDPTPSNCLGKNHKVFAPDFPASCPYLTSVGATQLPPGSNPTAHQEEAVTRFPSGGGFSNIYKRPSWQEQAVTDYFNRADPGYPYYESVNNNSFGANGGIYNRIGRGYPDVSAVGDYIVIYNMGLPTLIGGTSASSPLWGAVITRVNEERLKAGKKPVGFINPTLYAHPEVFFDVIKGSNPGCGTNGFSCAKGWDPVTGMGTPNYPALVSLFLSLP